MAKLLSELPLIDINTEAILLKADKSPYAMTMQSSLSGTAFAISKDGGILILNRHGFFGLNIDDMRVIHQELEYVIEETERWLKT